MHTQSALALALVAAIAWISPAGGVVTATAPLRSSSDSLLGCSVLNLSATAVEVSAELYNGFAADALESGTLEIPPGQSRQIVSSSAAIFGGYCLFDFDGEPSEVRGFVQMQDQGGSNTRQIFPAEPIGERRLVEIVAHTLPVRSSEGDNLICTAQNLGDDPVQVTGALENGLGTVVDENTLTVEPRRTLTLAFSNDAIFGGFCRFTFTGNRTTLRGYIQLQDAGGSNTRLLQVASTVDAAEPEGSPTPSHTPADAPTCPPPPATPTPGEAPTCGPLPTPEPCNGDGCCGDCNGNGIVQINELVTAVGFALESCPAP